MKFLWGIMQLDVGDAMFKKKELTRLGEILVSKGLITPEQLAIATHEQSKRNQALALVDAKAKGILIGEILVELGFIDQLELKRGLSWQHHLRHVSFAMALCAPFMVFAPASASAQTTSSNSSSQSAKSVTILAKNYASMLGVLNQSTTDVGGGQNIYNFTTGDWMSFANASISVPANGTYTITYRVASTNSASSFALKEASNDAVLDTINVPNTGGWQTWVDVKRTVTLTKGVHSFKLVSIAGNINMNWFRIDNVSLASAASSTPIVSTAGALPATVQAENFASMIGVWNETTSDVGGGQDTANITASDWISYSNIPITVPTTGSYKFTYRVATTNGNSSFALREASTDATLDTVTLPNTGGWQTWVDVTRTVNLTQGVHTFKIYSTAGNFNINWFKVEAAGSAVQNSVASAVASSIKSSAAVSSAVSSTPAKTASSTTSAATSTTTSTGANTTSSAASSSVNRVAGPVALLWTPPALRENGSTLDITELGGYEIRYKKENASTFTYVTINDPWTSQYNFSWLEGNYVFQIAAFDKNGNYSSFADINPK